MDKKAAATSRCGQLVNFLVYIRDFFSKDVDEECPIIQKYEIDNLINYLSNVEDRGVVPIDCEGISFKVRASNMNPEPKLKYKTFDVILSMKYDWLEDGKIREKKTDDEKKNGVSEIYNCQIEIKAIDEDEGKHKKFSWHLDCEEEINGKYVHPHFHFHAGGRRISGLDPGRLLMISSPRIAYPPMDLPLAINFVIRNFIHSKEMAVQHAILTRDQYKSYIEKSVDNILKPYFKEVHDTIKSSDSHYFPILL